MFGVPSGRIQQTYHTLHFFYAAECWCQLLPAGLQNRVMQLVVRVQHIALRPRDRMSLSMAMSVAGIGCELAVSGAQVGTKAHAE